MKKIDYKKYLNKDLITYILMFLTFMSFSFYTNIYTKTLIDLNYYGFDGMKYKALWIGFSLSWILIMMLILYLMPKKRRIILFTILSIFWGTVFVSQICYVQQLGKFMIFSDLFVAGEGLQYLTAILTNINMGMVATTLIAICLLVTVQMINKGSKNEKIKKNKIVIALFIVAIIITRSISYFGLGSEELENKWKENSNPKNIYIDYTNPNTSMFISGMYEYNIRAIYKYFYNLFTLDKTQLKYNIDEYNNIYGLTNSDNLYTGVLKDKNVIFIMMESIDSWIVDKTTMPTLYNLSKTGLNFTNRYSPFFNGGQTINSEFALNTGLYAISNKTTVYDIYDIEYKNSFANMLKKNGYKVNSFHANKGSFYNRSEFHKAMGYDNHYSAADMQEEGILDEDKNYYIDSELISDKVISDLIINKDNKFASFITTYSAHLEYTDYNKIYNEIEHKIDCEKNEYTEEECIYRTLASDTDKFISILIKKLKSNNLFDDTVIVLATDHFVYGYSSPDYVALKKNVINDRRYLQNTPLIIYNTSLEHKNIDTIMDTADVLPTLLNMLGIEYDPNKYIGTDVFSDNHDDFVWFADNTYIAGKDCSLSKEAILTKVNYNINKNKNILLTGYFGK